ncbi:hypothetical protein [Pseudomonas oryzihabitans]|uniref:hypothetical protein n=1 Tax=Pseudomonas oryzihabitans TaxID=47885 RepID=UPI002895B95A|nr:hypothetical protein [Pseudomonas oryzihabitans]MDT3718026.1 hypothetical protein [Pseudomonas oryzihabitans]
MTPSLESSCLDQRIMRVMEQDVAALVAHLCNLSLALTGSSANGAADMALQVVQKVELLVDDMKTLSVAAQELLDMTARPVRADRLDERIAAGHDEDAPFDDGQRD